MGCKIAYNRIKIEDSERFDFITGLSGEAKFLGKVDRLMLQSKESLESRNAIFEFEKKIDEMHLEVQRYCQGEVQKLPDWERLERDLVNFSRRKIFDLELSKQLDRVMYKFQNRKKIWLGWVEAYQQVKKIRP